MPNSRKKLKPRVPIEGLQHNIRRRAEVRRMNDELDAAVDQGKTTVELSRRLKRLVIDSGELLSWLRFVGVENAELRQRIERMIPADAQAAGAMVNEGWWSGEMGFVLVLQSGEFPPVRPDAVPPTVRLKLKQG